MNHVAVTIAKQHLYEITARTVALIKQCEKIPPTPLVTVRTTATKAATAATNTNNATPDTGLTLVQRMKFLETSLTEQLRYLETGNIKEWQAFVYKSIQDFDGRGFEYAQIIKSGQLSIQALWEFFQKELPKVGSTIEGIPTAEYLHKLRRRLDGLELVGTSVGMAIGLNRKVPNSNDFN
jgi:hypothetical protein